MYAIKIPYPSGDEWVTEGDSKFQLAVKLFDTRQDADNHAILWGDGAVVVEYNKDRKL